MNISPHFQEYLGKVIRQNRQQAGLSQAILAERAGVTRRFIQELENGRSDISLKTLTNLGLAMGKNLVDICGELEDLLYCNGTKNCTKQLSGPHGNE